MQTLISVFDDRAAARRAIDQLVASGFDPGDVHLRIADDDRVDQTGDDHAFTGEREVALGRNVLDSIGHFFVSLFGQDRGEKAAGTYGNAYNSGNALVIVDAQDDDHAEAAAVILHESGAIDVDDEMADASRPGVRLYSREAPSLRDIAQQRQLREESLLSDRAGQVSKEMKQDREEKAYASSMTHTDRDRPK